jgi:hypothetical protein
MAAWAGLTTRAFPVQHEHITQTKHIRQTARSFDYYRIHAAADGYTFRIRSVFAGALQVSLGLVLGDYFWCCDDGSHSRCRRHSFLHR